MVFPTTNKRIAGLPGCSNQLLNADTCCNKVLWLHKYIIKRVGWKARLVVHLWWWWCTGWWRWGKVRRWVIKVPGRVL